MAKSALRLALGLLIAAGAALAHAETVGRVLLAAGDAFAVREGKQVRLAFNAPIESKDVLRTGRASSLQVRFIDEGMISLRENSEFSIDEYRYSGKEDGDNRGFFSLVKGGFRAVTGAIGKTKNADYKVKTETATIGIRGTDYAVRDCRGDCGAGVSDGLYGTVMGMSNGTNQITLSNNTGEHSFGISQHFHVASANSVPQPLLQPPTFVSLRPQGKASATAQGGTGSGTEQASASTGASAESRPAETTNVSLTTPLITQPFQVTQNLGSAGTPTALPTANGFVAAFPLNPGLNFGDVFFDEDVNGPVTVNGQNQLTGFGTLGTYPAGSLAGGTIADTGSVTMPNGQVFVWGRWTGPTQITISSGSTLTGIPLLFGTASGIPQNNQFVGVVGGSASYSYAGGPKPVDMQGNVGTVTSSSLFIDFTQLQAMYSAQIQFASVLVSGSNTGSATLTVSGIGNHGSGSGEFSGSLSGTCSGAGCASGTANGKFGVGLAGNAGYEFAVVPGLVQGTQAGTVAFLNVYNATSYTPGPAPVGPLTGQAAWSHNSPSLAGTWSLDTNNTVYNSSNQPISFNQALSGVPKGALGAGSIVEAGNTTLVDGSTMFWGRWQGGQINDPINGVVTVNSGVPFVVGNANTIVPTSGSFVYNLAGGPNVTTNTGAVGSPITAGAFLINFGTSWTLSVSTPLQFSVAGTSTSLTSCSANCTSPNSSVVAGNVGLSGTCSGGACGGLTAVSGNAAAILIGPQAAGLAVAGNIFLPSGITATIAGGFKR